MANFSKDFNPLISVLQVIRLPPDTQLQDPVVLKDGDPRLNCFFANIN